MPLVDNSRDCHSRHAGQERVVRLLAPYPVYLATPYWSPGICMATPPAKGHVTVTEPGKLT
jgi:hypothetical protein